MSDIEAMDPRTDVKTNIETAYLATNEIADGNLKRPSFLTTCEIIGIYDAFLCREFAWLTGQSLSQCFYEFVYIHFQDLVKENSYIDCLVNHSQASMRQVYHMIQQTGCANYDEFQVSLLGFYNNPEEIDVQNQKLKNLENGFSSKLSKIKKKNYDDVDYKIEDAISARLSLRRGFTNLIFALKKQLHTQKPDNIIQHLNICEKNLEICKRTLKFSTDIDSYFNNCCIKTLLCQLSVRTLKVKPVEEIYQDFLEMLGHIRQIINQSQLKYLGDIFQKLEKFSSQETNVLVKVFLNMNLLCNDKHYFSTNPIIDIVWRELEDNGVKSQGRKESEELAQFEETAVIVIQNVFVKLLKGRCSFHGKLNKKAFLELSYFQHEAAKVDELLDDKTKPFLLFAYQHVLHFNIMKLEMSFGMDLLTQFELVWFWMHQEDAYTLLCTNMKNQITKFGMHWFNVVNADKEALKIKFANFNERQAQILSKFNEMRIKNELAKAMWILTAFLMKIGMIDQYMPEDEIDLRFTERFLPFEPCIYIKRHNYEGFSAKYQKEIAKEDMAMLSECKAKFLDSKAIADAIINNGLFSKEYEKKFLDLRKVYSTIID